MHPPRTRVMATVTALVAAMFLGAIGPLMDKFDNPLCHAAALVFSSGWAWAGFAFLVGLSRRSKIESAVLASSTLAVAVVVYYVFKSAFPTGPIGQVVSHGSGGELASKILVWGTAAFVFGAPVGLFGNLARTRGIGGLPFRLLIPLTAFYETSMRLATEAPSQGLVVEIHLERDSHRSGGRPCGSAGARAGDVACSPGQARRGRGGRCPVEAPLTRSHTSHHWCDHGVEAVLSSPAAYWPTGLLARELDAAPARPHCSGVEVNGHPGPHAGSHGGPRGLGGVSVETELVALDVLHHDARLVGAVGKQRPHVYRVERDQSCALGLECGEALLTDEPGARPYAEVHPILDDLAFGNALEEQPRAHT